VPDSDELRLHIVQGQHDTALEGRLGRAKTFDLLDPGLYWKGICKDVDRHVRNCHNCQRSQISRHSTIWVLRPLPVPDKPSEDISMDYIMGLLEWEGFDTIWEVVDQLLKM